MTPISANLNEEIVRLGSIDSNPLFYAIETGGCDVYVSDAPGSVPVARLSLSSPPHANAFGEVALVFDRPRTATIRVASQTCKLWALDRLTFRTLRMLQKRRRVADAVASLSQIKLLSDLSIDQLRRVAEACSYIEFEEDDVIIAKGDKNGKEFYMIQDGMVEVSEINGTAPGFTVLLHPGDSFGESALLTNEPRNATVTCRSKRCVCLVMQHRAFNALLGSLENVIDHNTVFYTLKTVVKSLEGWSEQNLRKMASCAVKIEIEPGQTVAHMYELCDRFAIIRSGKCLTEETEEVVPSGACIGVEMFGDEQPAHFPFTVVATTKVVLVEISWHDIEGLMASVRGKQGCDKAEDGDSNMDTGSSASSHKESDRKIGRHKRIASWQSASPAGPSRRTRKEDADWDILSEAAPHLDVYGNAGASPESRSSSPAGNDSNNKTQLDTPSHYAHKLSSLEILYSLGVGKFGAVNLAKDPDGATIVLKAMEKGLVVEANAVSSIHYERKLLGEVTFSAHPFICRLVSTFQDHECVYLGLEYLPGGSLESLKRSAPGGILQANIIQFYLRCISSAMEHLHQNNIIHRDCRADNFMQDEQGYPKLLDFGLSKRLKFGSGITFTVCGAPEFMAPEIILGSGHGVAADCWTIGVMCYDLAVGTTPFAARSIADSVAAHGVDPMEIIKNILEGDVQFPEHFGVAEDGDDSEPRLIPDGTTFKEDSDGELNGMAELMKCFISDLLDRDPSTRLGCGDELKMSNHTFLKMSSAAEADALHERQMTPPWVPPKNHAITASPSTASSSPPPVLVSTEVAEDNSPNGRIEDDAAHSVVTNWGDIFDGF